MPRKSRELRLAQTVDLISKYEEAGYFGGGEDY